MPRVSSFYGITIAMYYSDHPPPHFHVVHEGHEAMIALGNLRLIGGWLPRRAARLVREWARLHVDELAVNWERARRHLPLAKIEPLP